MSFSLRADVFSTPRGAPPDFPVSTLSGGIRAFHPSRTIRAFPDSRSEQSAKYGSVFPDFPCSPSRGRGTPSPPMSSVSLPMCFQLPAARRPIFPFPPSPTHLRLPLSHTVRAPSDSRSKKTTKSGSVFPNFPRSTAFLQFVSWHGRLLPATFFAVRTAKNPQNAKKSEKSG